MFVSQVIFESEKENEQKLKEIMKKKTASTADAPGFVASECWLKKRWGYGGIRAGDQVE